ncbi:hypothetical protein FN846DRAFT_893103 [Sphaerosporella brunnea]|uniref:Uncharacterized protein n=1 Tax=Sphaerosporella brunnea TaxID=1250544 RepID=A0A5J5ENI1_9PEZI|nr:hypothetical protein FN846DRAFT_893103 [Sphaerosporella brunnea]
MYLSMEPFRCPEHNAISANTNAPMTTASPIDAMEPASIITDTAQPTTGNDQDPEDDQEPIDRLDAAELPPCPFLGRMFQRLVGTDSTTFRRMLTLAPGRWGTTLLKFSIKDDPEKHVYHLNRETVETWEVRLKIGVMEDTEIDMDAITDMFGDRSSR